MSDRRALLRHLPAIDRLLSSPQLGQLEQSLPHILIREAAQKVVDELRQQVLDERAPLPEMAFDTVVERTAARACMTAPALLLTTVAASPPVRRQISSSTWVKRLPRCPASRSYSRLE